MRAQYTRIAVFASLFVALAVVAVILIGGGGPNYKVHAMFPDAGQIVKGGLVEVGGREVGTIDKIALSDNGQADVTLKLTSNEVAPLHLGTRATIRAVGLSSVANRFVELSPGPDTAAKIPDGGTLDMTHTRGIVDLDELLDTFNEKTRGRLQNIIASTAKGLQDPTAGQLNNVLGYLDPALSQSTALGRELTLDQHALNTLVSTASKTASTLAARPQALSSALANTSATLAQVAAKRDALSDSLTRAAGVFGQTTTTLRNVQKALPAVNPVLKELRPAAPGVSKVFTQLVPLTKNLPPTFAAVQKLLPKARASLKPLPALAKLAVPALSDGASALAKLQPIVDGLRPYAPELIAGFFEGFGGSTSGNYDANGHYARISFNFGAGQLPGLLPTPPGGTGGLKTGLTSRCPGAATDPAGDKSNPYDPGNGVCDDSQSLNK